MHNEAHILRQFLQHYRHLGVVHFIFVDDHSTDETDEILQKVEDVTVFKPVTGSSYSKDKVAWRCDLLDHFCDGNWVLLPDLDEHLVYPHIETAPLQRLVNKFDADGAQAMYTTMIDMYGNRPLQDHVFSDGILLEHFPYFDRPAHPAHSYRMQPPASRFLKKYPTPAVHVYGGMRERQFFQGQRQIRGMLSSALLNRFANLNRPLNPNLKDRIANAITRLITKRLFPAKPFTLTKLALVKWKKGLKLSGGPHAVSEKLNLASTTGVFLHFKFTKGMNGLKYLARRGEHAGGGEYYQQILNQQELLSLSPYSKISEKYTSSQTLIDCGLMRDDWKSDE